MIQTLFFCSGVTALIYQIVWVRELILVFGASMFAISTVLTAFMGGLALGSWFFGRRADRYANPSLVYGLLELGIGGYALLIPFLFSSLIPLQQILWNTFHFSFYIFSLVRFAMAVLILITPTALMGGTLPVLARLYKERQEVGRGVGLLYAFNTLGAVVGVLGAGFVLLPMFGLQNNILLAAGLNGLIGLLAITYGRRTAPPSENETWFPLSPPTIPRRSRKTGAIGPAPFSPLSKGAQRQKTFLLLVFALSGLAAMIYEVVWTRVLTLILGSTLYSFATMLATFLLGLAVGSFIFSLLLRHAPRPLLLLALVQGGIALSAFVGEFLFPLMPTFFFKLLEIFHSEVRILSASKFFITGAVMLVPTLLMGGVFPLVIHALTQKESNAPQLGSPVSPLLGAIVGRAYAVNTVGTIIGSFAVGFILLPLFGIQKSLHIAISINALLSLALWIFAGKSSIIGVSQKPAFWGIRRWAGVGPAPLLLGVFALFFLALGFFTPAWNPLLMSSDLFGTPSTLDLLYYKEGISSTVTVVQHPTLGKLPHLTLAIDGKANASTTGDMKTQLLIGHLPMLLAPQAKEVMLVGLGSGITAGAIATHPLHKLVSLEIEPAVVEGARYFDSFNGKVLDDPRVRIVADDARNYLLLTRDLYDVIVSEPSHPWRSGSAKLFTEEFFRLGKAHLRPEGIFTQWIHFYGIRAPELKSVIRTFHVVFPQVLIFYTDAGDLILTGSERPFHLDRDEIAKRMMSPTVARDLGRIDVYSPFDLWAYFLLGPNEIERYTGSGILNTDDYTVVEFQTPKSLFEDTFSIHLSDMKGAARGTEPYLIHSDGTPADKGDDYYALAKGYLRLEKEEEAREMIQKGLLLHPTADGDWLWGIALQKREDRAGAERAWEIALQKDRSHPETLQSLAQLYQERGDFKKAAPLLLRLRKEHPDKIQAAFYHGVNLYYLGQYPEALEELNQGIPFSEPFVYYYQNLVYDKLKNGMEAQQALAQFIGSLNQWRKELETDPRRFSTLPYVKRVQWRRQTGIQIPEEERMAKLFDRLVSNPLNHFYSGSGLFILGYFKPATAELEEGIKQLGNQSSGSLAHYYLGSAYKETGQMKKAQEEWEGFVAHTTLDPDDLRVEAIKRALARLKGLKKGVS